MDKADRMYGDVVGYGGCQVVFCRKRVTHICHICGFNLCELHSRWGMSCFVCAITETKENPDRLEMYWMYTHKKNVQKVAASFRKAE